MNLDLETKTEKFVCTMIAWIATIVFFPLTAFVWCSVLHQSIAWFVVEQFPAIAWMGALTKAQLFGASIVWRFFSNPAPSDADLEISKGKTSVQIAGEAVSRPIIKLLIYGVAYLSMWAIHAILF